MRTKLLILLTVAAIACIGQGATVRESSSASAAIAYVDAQRNEHGNRGFRFRVTNTSSTPLFFDGYSLTSPLYELQFRRLGAFPHRIERGWCGTGVEPRRLAPGASTSFWVDDPGTIWPWAAGIAFRRHPNDRQQEFTVWSAPSKR